LWLREIGAKHITTVGWGPLPDGVSVHYQIPVLPLPKRYFGYLLRRHTVRFQFFHGQYLDKIPQSALSKLDLLVVNGVQFTPWLENSGALSNLPTYLDLHEDHMSDAFRGPLERVAFRKYLKWELKKLNRFVRSRKSAILISSVEEAIAKSYSELFSTPVEIILNAPDPNKLGPTEVDPNSIRLVHHGMGTKGRGIEKTIRALSRLDNRFSLDLILFATPQFRLKIELLSRLLNVRKRIHIQNGVPRSELSVLLNSFDVAVVLAPSKIPSHLNALPNKFFESIHSKLAVIVGPNPSMSKIVDYWKIGVTMNSWSSKELSTTLSSLSIKKITQAKKNAEIAAPQLSSHQSREVFKKLVLKLYE
jgi:glycosyltransferase involved in cell wall biosynthesis